MQANIFTRNAIIYIKNAMFRLHTGTEPAGDKAEKQTGLTVPSHAPTECSPRLYSVELVGTMGCPVLYLCVAAPSTFES